MTVSADQAFRPVTHVASGALYGLATDTIPSRALVAAIKPNTFVQMPPNGKQLPGGETAPAGDTLQVLKLASEVGAKVVVRMPDWFPAFPYSDAGDLDISEWDSEIANQVMLVEDSPYRSSVSAFAIWNEPNLNWTGSITDDSGNPLDFNTFWEDSYQEIRAIDPTAVIQGPSFSNYGSGSCSASGMTATYGADCGSIQAFLQFAQSTNTVPDIMSWHELGGQNSIEGDVANYRSYESSIIGKTLPIAIEEYAEPGEVGVPGDLVGYIAKFERSGVNNAEMPLWNEYGSLGDSLTGTGGAPNGAYWLYKWYGEMTGNMVTTTTSNVASGTDFDGAAAVSTNKKTVSVIFGGNSGATQVTINGLSKLALGTKVNVSLQYVPSYGREQPVAGPLTLSNTVETPSGGTINVSIPSMTAADGYRIVLTPAVTTPANLAGTYTIGNLNSGLNLSPSGSSVVQTASTPGTSQRWIVRSAGSGDYTIANAKTGLYLASASSTSTTGVTVTRKPTGQEGLWTFTSDNSGHESITNVATGEILGVQNRLTTTNVPVIQDATGAPTPVCTATTYRVPGVFGNAVSLCGDGEYVSLPDGIVSGLTSDYTVSAWVDPRSNTEWSRIFDFGTGTSSYMYLTVDNAGGDVAFAISTSGTPGNEYISSSYPTATYGQGGVASFQNSAANLLPLNKWSLITVTLSGSTGILYVNGVAVGENDDITISPGTLGETTQDWLGRSEYGDPNYNGSIDDFNIYNTTLSPAQVAALATAKQPGKGNVVDYTFNEATGATVGDSSGNGQTATIISDPYFASTEVGTSADQLWSLTKAS